MNKQAILCKLNNCSIDFYCFIICALLFVIMILVIIIVCRKRKIEIVEEDKELCDNSKVYKNENKIVINDYDAIEKIIIEQIKNIVEMNRVENQQAIEKMKAFIEERCKALNAAFNEEIKERITGLNEKDTARMEKIKEIDESHARHKKKN